jgi:hypothetical protein
MITRAQRAANVGADPSENQIVNEPQIRGPDNAEMQPEHQVADNVEHPRPMAAGPSPPQLCWAQRTHTPVNVDDALARAQNMLTTMEASWGLNTPSLANCWTNASDHDGLEQEVTSVWSPDGILATEIMVSAQHQVLLILNILSTGTEFRYITPYHVWGHTMCHDGSQLVAVDPEPTPFSTLPVLAATFVRSPSATAHAEMRLQIQHLLSNTSSLQSRHPFSITSAKCTYSKAVNSANLITRYKFSSINCCPRCPGCKMEDGQDGGPCNSKLSIVADRWFRNIRITCHRSKTTKIVNIGHSSFYLYLFELGTGHRMPVTPTPFRPPQGFAGRPGQTSSCCRTSLG